MVLLTATGKMVSQYLTNIHLSWANNGQPISNHHAFNGQPVAYLTNKQNVLGQYWATTIKPAYV